ncbi:MAG: GGDEF domain-containing protein [Anaerolineales bacterium]|nr:GGDEF domain-containing protein [Anaerolineales bacterium]
MKLSPTLSQRIRQFILKQGAAKSTLYITAISTLFSVVIAKMVAILLPGSSGDFNVVIAITVPLLVAPPLSYIFISLYFELEKLREEVHALAITDELTRVFNRRHFMRVVEHELERAKRYRHALSLIIFDADNFKKVNDTYGHLCGDAVLQELCLTCSTLLRQCDTLARFGGEEFILLLPETDEASALQVANRLCQLVAGHVVEYKGAQIQVTISVGVTTCNPTADTLDDLLSRADRALYQAKWRGKNRLEVL